MNAYNPAAKCPKCGGSEINSLWHRATEYPGYDCRNHGSPREEHVVRHCTCCRYEWAETPLDRQESSPVEVES